MKLLKHVNNDVYISEHLTKTASDLFFNERKLLREKENTERASVYKVLAEIDFVALETINS